MYFVFYSITPFSFYVIFSSLKNFAKFNSGCGIDHNIFTTIHRAIWQRCKKVKSDLINKTYFYCVNGNGNGEIYVIVKNLCADQIKERKQTLFYYNI